MATFPHVKERRQEVGELKRHPAKRARRWVVKLAHSWFNYFRKLLVRHEKLEWSFVTLNHLAAAINCLFGSFVCPRFNTQPPEGGCAGRYRPRWLVWVSTHSRPKAAASR